MDIDKLPITQESINVDYRKPENLPSWSQYDSYGFFVKVDNGDYQDSLNLYRSKIRDVGIGEIIKENLWWVTAAISGVTAIPMAIISEIMRASDDPIIDIPVNPDLLTIVSCLLLLLALTGVIKSVDYLLEPAPGRSHNKAMETDFVGSIMDLTSIGTQVYEKYPWAKDDKYLSQAINSALKDPDTYVATKELIAGLVNYRKKVREDKDLDRSLLDDMTEELLRIVDIARPQKTKTEEIEELPVSPDSEARASIEATRMMFPVQEHSEFNEKSERVI